jgi:hypothetical protein
MMLLWYDPRTWIRPPSTIKDLIEEAIKEAQKRLLENEHHASHYNALAHGERDNLRRLHSQLQAYTANKMIHEHAYFPERRVQSAQR